jgi:hypothetical protein
MTDLLHKSIPWSQCTWMKWQAVGSVHSVARTYDLYLCMVQHRKQQCATTLRLSYIYSASVYPTLALIKE